MKIEHEIDPQNEDRQMTQYYDVHNHSTGQFVLRAELPTISQIYQWTRYDEGRIENARAKGTIIYGNEKHEDVIVKPVMNDWTPSSK